MDDSGISSYGWRRDTKIRIRTMIHPYKCRACGLLSNTAICSDAFCGATCDPLRKSRLNIRIKSMKLKITDSEETYFAEVSLHSCLQLGDWDRNPYFLINNWDRTLGDSARIILKNVYEKGYDLIELNNGDHFLPLFLAKILKINLKPGDRFLKKGESEEFIFVDLGHSYGYRYAITNSVSGKLERSFKEQGDAEELLFENSEWEKL